MLATDYTADGALVKAWYETDTIFVKVGEDPTVRQALTLENLLDFDLSINSEGDFVITYLAEDGTLGTRIGKDHGERWESEA